MKSRIIPTIIAAAGLMLGTAANAATYTLEFTSTTHYTFDPTVPELVVNDADDYRFGETFVTTINIDTDIVGSPGFTPPLYELVESATIYRDATGETSDVGSGQLPPAYLRPQSRNGSASFTIDLNPINLNENALVVTLYAALNGASQPTTAEEFLDLYVSQQNSGSTNIEFLLGGAEPILGIEDEDFLDFAAFVTFDNDLTAATRNGVAINLSPVPLPAGGLLLLGALLGAAGLRRKS